MIADNWSAPVAVACPNVIGKFLTRDGKTEEALYQITAVTAVAEGKAVTVVWRKQRRGNAASYRITLTPTIGASITRRLTPEAVEDGVDVERFSLKVRGLTPGRTYLVTVVSTGKASTRSEPITVTVLT